MSGRHAAEAEPVVDPATAEGRALLAEIFPEAADRLGVTKPSGRRVARITPE